MKAKNKAQYVERMNKRLERSSHKGNGPKSESARKHQIASRLERFNGRIKANEDWKPGGNKFQSSGWSNEEKAMNYSRAFENAKLKAVPKDVRKAFEKAQREREKT